MPKKFKLSFFLSMSVKMNTSTVSKWAGNLSQINIQTNFFLTYHFQSKAFKHLFQSPNKSKWNYKIYTIIFFEGGNEKKHLGNKMRITSRTKFFLSLRTKQDFHHYIKLTRVQVKADKFQLRKQIASE